MNLYLYNIVAFMYRKLYLLRCEECDLAISALKVVCNLSMGGNSGEGRRAMLSESGVTAVSPKHGATMLSFAK